MFPVCTIDQIDPIDPIDPVDTMDPIDQIDAVESLGRSQGTGVLGVICLGWEACRAQRRFAIMFVCSFLLPLGQTIGHDTGSVALEDWPGICESHLKRHRCYIVQQVDVFD